jgi:hypothetical protein
LGVFHGDLGKVAQAFCWLEVGSYQGWAEQIVIAHQKFSKIHFGGFGLQKG